MPPAAATAADAVRFLTNFISAAVDDKRLCVDDRVGNLEPCLFVELGHRRSRDLHLLGALSVRTLLKIDDAYDFVLFNEQNNRFGCIDAVWRKALDGGFTADSAAANGSWHDSRVFDLIISDNCRK